MFTRSLALAGAAFALLATPALADTTTYHYGDEVQHELVLYPFGHHHRDIIASYRAPKVVRLHPTRKAWRHADWEGTILTYDRVPVVAYGPQRLR